MCNTVQKASHKSRLQCIKQVQLLIATWQEFSKALFAFWISTCSYIAAMVAKYYMSSQSIIWSFDLSMMWSTSLNKFDCLNAAVVSHLFSPWILCRDRLVKAMWHTTCQPTSSFTFLRSSLTFWTLVSQVLFDQKRRWLSGSISAINSAAHTFLYFKMTTMRNLFTNALTDASLPCAAQCVGPMVNSE